MAFRFLPRFSALGILSERLPEQNRASRRTLMKRTQLRLAGLAVAERENDAKKRKPSLRIQLSYHG